MPRPNELADTLEIDRDPSRWGHPGSLCSISFSDIRHEPTMSDRPAAITLCGDAFEATYRADYDDLVRMRDWLNTAIGALEATRPELRAVQAAE